MSITYSYINCCIPTSCSSIVVFVFVFRARQILQKLHSILTHPWIIRISVIFTTHALSEQICLDYAFFFLYSLYTVVFSVQRRIFPPRIYLSLLKSLLWHAPGPAVGYMFAKAFVTFERESGSRFCMINVLPSNLIWTRNGRNCLLDACRRALRCRLLRTI